MLGQYHDVICNLMANDNDVRWIAHVRKSIQYYLTGNRWKNSNPICWRKNQHELSNVDCSNKTTILYKSEPAEIAPILEANSLQRLILI